VDADVDALAGIAEALGVTLVDWYGPPVECAHGYAADARLTGSLRHVVASERAVPAGYEAWGAAFWVGFYDLVLRFDG
jgi:hypothetical protein